MTKFPGHVTFNGHDITPSDAPFYRDVETSWHVLTRIMTNLVIQNPPFPMQACARRNDPLQATINVVGEVRDIASGAPIELMVSHKLQLLSTRSERSIVDIVRQLMRDLCSHEIDECLHYQGERLYDPHKAGA